MSDQIFKPHPLNAPGVFYVASGCCTGCGIPESVAPEFFGWDKNYHCFVKKQPQTEVEFDTMIDVINSSEFDCIRYRGSDQSFLTRLAENGYVGQADFPPAVKIQTINRTHVSFDVTDTSRVSLISLASEFKDHLMTNAGKTKYAFRGPEQTFFRRRAWIEYSWYEARFHRVDFERTGIGRGSTLVRAPDDIGHWSVTRALKNWIQDNSCYANIMWFTKEQWEAGVNGAKKPW